MLIKVKAMTKKKKPSCGPKPNLNERELVSNEQASELEELFKVLANDTRIRLLHVLIRANEAAVNQIAEELDMTVQAVSSHLQKLAGMKMVETRRKGNFIYYRLIDPCVSTLLDRGLCLLEERAAWSSGPQV